MRTNEDAAMHASPPTDPCQWCYASATVIELVNRKSEGFREPEYSPEGIAECRKGRLLHPQR